MEARSVALQQYNSIWWYTKFGTCISFADQPIWRHRSPSGYYVMDYVYRYIYYCCAVVKRVLNTAKRATRYWRIIHHVKVRNINSHLYFAADSYCGDGQFRIYLNDSYFEIGIYCIHTGIVKYISRFGNPRKS